MPIPIVGCADDGADDGVSGSGCGCGNGNGSSSRFKATLAVGRFGEVGKYEPVIVNFLVSMSVVSMTLNFGWGWRAKLNPCFPSVERCTPASPCKNWLPKTKESFEMDEEMSTEVALEN